MDKQIIIERTLKIINELPAEKAEEISFFAEYLMKRYEEGLLNVAIQKLASESKAFEFLNEDEAVYTLSDAKEVYNAKG